MTFKVPTYLTFKKMVGPEQHNWHVIAFKLNKARAIPSFGECVLGSLRASLIAQYNKRRKP
jgi:hypothetical protein